MSEKVQFSVAIGATQRSQRASLASLFRGYSLRAGNGVGKLLARMLLRYLASRCEFRSTMERVGEGEGSWIIPTKILKNDGLAYCVGVGTNASFDADLAANHGMRVFSIDPTPIAIKYMETLPRDRSRHRFLSVGVWDADTNLRLYAPMSASANLSAYDIHGTGQYIDLPVRTLGTIMQEQGHNHIDLLKIDIEGSWYKVVADMCKSNISVSILCAEFDTPTSPIKALRAVRMLNAKGLELVHADRENLTFVSKELMRYI